MSPLIKPDGLYRLRREDYDAIERHNYSKLKLIGRSPAHYRHGLLEDRADTDALKAGRVTHLAVLEPERFRSLVAVWDGGRRAGKDWDKFVEQNEGRELLTEEEYKLCLALQQAVRNDRYAMPYISSGKPEITVLWSVEISGQKVQCKARLDFDSDAAVVELKTTRCGAKEDFGRQSYGLKYHTQGAWQVDGYTLVTGIDKPHVTVSVEKDPPHVVTVYRMPERYLQVGRTEYMSWLARLLECSEKSIWPGYAEGELELQWPGWADNFGDPTGLGLEID